MLRNLILNSYKKCISFKEILDAFVNSRSSESLMLWQKDHETRNVIWVRTWELDHSNERIIVNIDEKSSVFMDSTLPVYIKLPFREAILKTQIEIHSKTCFYLKIPTELYWREFRQSSRLVFEFGQRVAELRVTPSEIFRSDSNLTYKVFLKDISKGGVALLVSESQISLFKSQRQMEFLSIDGSEMLTPRPAEIVYIQKDHHPSQKGTWFRVGLKMLRPLTDDFIQKLNNSDSQVLKSQTIECFSGEFKVMIEKEMELTLKRIKKNPALSKYLDQIEISRKEDAYLEEHIKVLCIVCSFIARSINWITDLSLQKLIYVAYLHDAPFLSHPRLAKISNLREFEKVKNKLTSDEQKLFLTSPERSFAIALSDESAPPDTPQILLMQKELPDGSGFPRKLASQKITPLAAIFIVGHDLTNEIMAKRDWSMESWLSKARLTYRSGHFIKIMDTLEASKHLFRRK